jgi:hypothetical protein
MGASSSGDNAKMELHLFGQRFCYVGFCRAYSLSRKKLTAATTSSSMEEQSPSMLAMALSPSTAKNNAQWLSAFFYIIGDCLLDGTLHCHNVTVEKETGGLKEPGKEKSLMIK